VRERSSREEARRGFIYCEQYSTERLLSTFVFVQDFGGRQRVPIGLSWRHLFLLVREVVCLSEKGYEGGFILVRTSRRSGV
jgi:hypothetical protein